MTATAHINLSAFEHNVRLIVGTVSPARVWLAVKANAYGHGMTELADNAVKAGASGLAVLDIESAVRLRRAGISAPLFAWLHGVTTDFETAVDLSIDIGVSTRELLDHLASIDGVARVHLKIDTGLHRNGASAAEWESLCRHADGLQRQGRIHVVGVWSHLADAGREHDERALSLFHHAIDIARTAGLAPELCHIAASSAALDEPDARMDLVRVGIAAYGISPFDDRTGHELGLRPVMTLETQVTHVAPETATIGAGWADGVPLGDDYRGDVTIEDVRFTVRNVHARSTEIYLGNHRVSVGDRCTIFGNDSATAEEWAAWVGTIGDEIVTSVPASVRRVYG